MKPVTRETIKKKTQVTIIIQLHPTKVNFIFYSSKYYSIIFFDTEKNIKFPTLGIHISHKKRRNSQHGEHLKTQNIIYFCTWHFT